LSQNKIRVGIVGNPGQAWMGRAHVPALRSLPDFEIVAVCTSRLESAKAAAKEFGIAHAFADPSEMARHPDVDMVDISVKVPSHHKPVMAALEAGKHVYCEWPLGVSAKQAQEMAETAKRKGVRNMVGLQSRAAPAINRLKDLVAEGYIGRVLSCTLLSSNPIRGERVPQEKVWSSDVAGGQHTLTISGGHCLDAIRYCLGDIAELSGTVKTQYPDQTVIETGEKFKKTAPDQVVVNGTLKSGAVLAVHIQYGTYNATGLWLEVNGTDGDLVVYSEEQSGIQMSRLRLKGSQRGAAEEKQPMVELPIPESYRWVPSAVPSGPPENVAQMYAKLAESIRKGNGAGLDPDFNVALSMHHIVEAVRASSETGRRQTI
jgi:predicted dehydrogenase